MMEEGGVEAEKKPACLREEVGAGIVHIKYREMMGLVHAHYSQSDTDTPSPTEVSPFFSHAAGCHPTPTPKCSGLKLMHKMESQGMSCNFSRVLLCWNSNPLL